MRFVLVVLPNAAHAEKRLWQHNARWGNPSILVPVTLAWTVAGPLRTRKRLSCSRVDDRESGWMLTPLFKKEPEYVKCSRCRMPDRYPQLRIGCLKDQNAAFMEQDVVLSEYGQVLFKDY